MSRSPLCMCLHVPTYSQFFASFCFVILANMVNFLFPFLWCFIPSFPWLFIFSFLLPIISPFLISFEPGAVAGSQRLQQIINATNPLEIQADVHWTHVHEKEEEERTVPTSEPSTSRGNCFRIQGPEAPRSIFCPCNPSACCRVFFCQGQSHQFNQM